MKKMYVCFDIQQKYGEFDAFFDESFNLVGFVNSDDAKWRHEYFNSILKHFDLEVKNIEPENIPDYQQKLEQYNGF